MDWEQRQRQFNERAQRKAMRELLIEENKARIAAKKKHAEFVRQQEKERRQAEKIKHPLLTDEERKERQRISARDYMRRKRARIPKKVKPPKMTDEQRREKRREYHRIRSYKERKKLAVIKWEQEKEDRERRALEAPVIVKTDVQRLLERDKARRDAEHWAEICGRLAITHQQRIERMNYGMFAD